MSSSSSLLPVRLLAALAVSAVALVLSASPAQSEDLSLTVDLAGPAVLALPGRSEVTVPVTVQCGVIDDLRNGTVSVTLRQVTRGGTVEGTGSAPLLCDGVTRTVDISVRTASSERWRVGAASATATAHADGFLAPTEICAQYPDGTVVCTPWTPQVFLDATDGPESIALVTH